MATIEERINDYRENLRACGPADEQLNWLVDRSKRSPGLTESQRRDQFLVPGCLSKLWLIKENKEGLCVFHADAEAAIVRALALLYAEIYSGARPQEILDSARPLAEQLDIQTFISPTRRNVLLRMHEQIFTYALHALGEAGNQAG
jgi:cysteine desulfuration protein SufE